MISDEELRELKLGINEFPIWFDPEGLPVETTEDWANPIAMTRDLCGLVLGYATNDSGGMIWKTPDTRCWISLADRVSRCRVLEFLGKKHGVPSVCGVPTWVPTTFCRYSLRSEPFRSGRDSHHVQLFGAKPGSDIYYDDRLLPDGSRFVDALNLAYTVRDGEEAP